MPRVNVFLFGITFSRYPVFWNIGQYSIHEVCVHSIFVSIIRRVPKDVTVSLRKVFRKIAFFKQTRVVAYVFRNDILFSFFLLSPFYRQRKLLKLTAHKMLLLRRSFIQLQVPL